MGIYRANEQYNIKITDFEGPLDLLLHLIRESKLDIKTVKLAEVTGQYVEFLSQLDELDLDLASEFIEVGATLLDIKSRQILPRVTKEDVEDLEKTEERLRAQIEEYKILKEASEELHKHEMIGRFYKQPTQIKEVIKYNLDNIGMDALVDAFARVMHRIEQKAAKIGTAQIKKDRFTVADKMNELRKILQDVAIYNLTEMFDDDLSKSEIINCFLAVLELLKGGEARVVQEEKFGEIVLKRQTPEGREGREIAQGEVIDDYN